MKIEELHRRTLELIACAGVPLGSLLADVGRAMKLLDCKGKKVTFARFQWVHKNDRCESSGLRRNSIHLTFVVSVPGEPNYRKRRPSLIFSRSDIEQYPARLVEEASEEIERSFLTAIGLPRAIPCGGFPGYNPETGKHERGQTSINNFGYHHRSPAPPPANRVAACSGCNEAVTVVPRDRESWHCSTCSREIERNRMTKALRFSVLERDGFSCRACGRSPEGSDVSLEVDHIRPISKGGKTEPSNLQTLCHDCNQGKSDRIVPAMMETCK